MQTARHLPMNRTAKLLSVLVVPVFVAAIWRIALALHWWTALLFGVISLVVGAINAVTARRLGGAGLFGLQSATGLIGAALTAAGWIFRPGG